MDWTNTGNQTARKLRSLAILLAAPAFLAACAGVPPAASRSAQLPAAASAAVVPAETPANSWKIHTPPVFSEAGAELPTVPVFLPQSPLETAASANSTPLDPDNIGPAVDNAANGDPVFALGGQAIVVAPQHDVLQSFGDEPVADVSANDPLSVYDDAEPSMPPANIWDRIRAGFRLPKLNDPRVAYHERWFTRNPKYMQRKMQRARLYLYHIVEEVERHGMPMEIALLPAIESAYQPHAYSHARASGLWQFIAPTARRYGLKINWWYDGRRDVVASTTAALNYLEKLYTEFGGDWQLALAAYNAGERKIHWAIRNNQRRGLATNYMYLTALRPETRNYVPKLMAMVNIVSNPQAYGIELEPIANRPYFARVDVGSQIDLKVLAELAKLPVGDFFDINPGFSRWASDPNGPHQVLVPIEKRDTLLQALEELPTGSWIRWRHHRVKRGDTLSAIARRNRVSVSAVRRANSIRGSLIHPGQDLIIPLSSRPLSKQVAHITRPFPRKVARPRRRVRAVHRVRQGDTLWSIARTYRVYVKQLARWNSIGPRDTLRIGTKLRIW